MRKPVSEATVLEAAKAAALQTGRLSDGTLVVLVTCPRCWGSGHYSSCQQYATRCFQCNVASGGKLIGKVWMNAAKWHRAQKRREAEQRRRERLENERKAQECYEQGRGIVFVPLADLEAATREHMARLAAEAAAARLARKQFIGREGETVERTVVLEKIIRGGDRFRRWSLSIMRDVEADSRVIWWNRLDADEGDTVRIRGTVKAHELRDGEKQTVLTRVKVLYDEQPGA